MTDFATPLRPLHVRLIWLPDMLNGMLHSAIDVLAIASAILQLRQPGSASPLTWEIVDHAGNDASPRLPGPSAYASAIPDQVDAARTLILIGGLYAKNATDVWTISEKYPALLDTLRAHWANGGMVAACFNGLVFPARCGMLDGLSVGAHWGMKSFFVLYFPNADFSDDAPMRLHERVFTCVSPADLIAFLIQILRRQVDADLADACGQILQFQPHRQSLSNEMVEENLLGRTSESPVFRATEWLKANIAMPYNLTALTSVAAVSERTLLRHFKAAVGVTPLEFLQSLRIERAKVMLEVSLNDIHTIAVACGYSSTSAFHRLFLRDTGVTPAAYRKRFTLRSKRVHWRVESALNKT